MIASCLRAPAVYGARDFAETLMPTVEAVIKTPCNRICVIHPTLRLCTGCGRSLDEIARWIELTDTERSQIMVQLPARLAATGSAKAARA
jgi:predicted Fe-S protein YdhL (DUF1289 family)